MKIEILCGEGSQNGVHLSDLFGSVDRIGVGGSEYALLTMCEAWTKRGDEVVLYNNPKRQDGVFEQRSVNAFNKNDHRDVLIVFRQPTSKVLHANGLKVFWSCDQYTVGDFKHFSQFVDKAVTISPFHTKHFESTYGINGAISIDLPVRTWEYDQSAEKIDGRIIFTSVPDRGLDAVHKIFPSIKKLVPNASIVITSDYRLWGSMSPSNQGHIMKFAGMDGVSFIGAVKRDRLIQEQLSAQVHLYPFTGTTEELFCLSVAESQVAGVVPITSTDGALETTNMGVQIEGNARDLRNAELFINAVVSYLKNPELSNIQNTLSQRARERFDVSRIMKIWDEEVFDGQKNYLRK